MYEWLLNSWRTVGYVALTTVLIYLSTVLAIRWLGLRRALAEMTVFDFAVGVALGAVIGRTATTPSPSYVQGITAVVALLLAHNGVSWLRLHVRVLRSLVGRPPVVLVTDGKIDERGLKRAELTHDDLLTVLREHGVGRLSDVRLAALESRGSFSVISSGSVDTMLWPSSDSREQQDRDVRVERDGWPSRGSGTEAR